MNLIQIKEFFAEYSASTLLIALAIAVINFFLTKAVKKEKFKKLIRLAPLLLGVAFSFVFESISAGKLSFTEHTVYTGAISATLSACFSVLVKRILSGEKIPQTETQLVILSIIERYVKKEALNTVIAFIESVVLGTVVDGALQLDDFSTQLEKVSNAITENANGQMDGEQAKGLAEVVIASVNQLKE